MISLGYPQGQAPEDREGGLSTAVADKVARAVEVFAAPFFLCPCSAVDDGSGLVTVSGGGTSAWAVEDYEPVWVPK